jgi:VirK protein
VLTRFPIALVAVGAALNFMAGAANAKVESKDQYQQLRTVLFSGERTTAIFSPNECRSSQQAQGATQTPAVSGGFVIRDFIEVNGNMLAFANEHVTVRPSGAAVLELIQYRVMANNSATVTVRSLSPTTYQPVAEPQVFQCALGNGLRFAYASKDRD